MFRRNLIQTPLILYLISYPSDLESIKLELPIRFQLFFQDGNMTDITTRLGRKFSKISLGGVTEDNLEEVGEGDEEVKVKSDDVTDETSPDDIHEDTSNENYEKPDNKDKFMIFILDSYQISTSKNHVTLMGKKLLFYKTIHFIKSLN